jgi:hypothetical protein
MTSSDDASEPFSTFKCAWLVGSTFGSAAQVMLMGKRHVVRLSIKQLVMQGVPAIG